MPLIRIWVVEHALASSIAAPVDIFAAANRLAGAAPGQAGAFAWRVESIDGKPVRTASGQVVAVDGRIQGGSAADAVWLTGPFVSDIGQYLDQPGLLHPLLDALRKQHARGTLIATYCTGAFLLADGGVLHGRLATTRWPKASGFRARYPDIALRAFDALTEQDNILCSGSTSNAHLALRLVERFAGAAIAAAVARAMLIDPNGQRRACMDGGRADGNAHGDELVARAQSWMERHLHEPFDVGSLGRHLAVSERTLARRFKAAVGMPPLKYLQAVRMEAARRLLASRRFDVAAVAGRVGYADLASFRQLFKRSTGMSPGEYRRRAGRDAAGEESVGHAPACPECHAEMAVPPLPRDVFVS